jgi:hypothetical protein
LSEVEGILRLSRREEMLALKLASSVVRKIGTVALIGYMAWSGWENLGPEKPPIGPIRKELVDRVIPTIVEDVRTCRGELRRTALVHFSNDSTDYFTDSLRRAIQQAGILDLHDRTLSEKVRNLLNLRHPSRSSTDAAVKYGEHLDTKAVLYGVVHAFESYSDGAKIDVEVHLADTSTAQDVFSKRYQVETSPGSSIMASVQETTQAFPWFQRLFGWLLTVLLLPVFTINFIRAMVHKKSNRTNALVLAIYTATDAFLAWLLVGAVLNSWLPAVIFLFAVAAAFIYNIRIMTFALRLET